MNFDEAFFALTGFQPFPWQQRLHQEFLNGAVPQRLDIPTGLGKTSVIPIWLAALCEMAERHGTGLGGFPRRLFYVVHRRTLVDQATQQAEELRERIEGVESRPHLQRMHNTLAQLAPCGENTLAVSTLRGKRADNSEWKYDPARAAVIVGTVDMIGSKLLFSGYGDSKYYRPHHAGLVGHDALIVHDEAHLTRPFGHTLRTVSEMQRSNRNLRIMEMSATADKGDDTLRLEADDESHPIVKKRLNAAKSLWVRTVPHLVNAVFEEALKHEDGSKRVLIFLNSPNDVSKIARKLRGAKSIKPNASNRVAVLTGTMRSYEREKMLKSSPVFKAMLNGTPVDETLYLICTSAGEVGIDMDAEVLISESVPLDSLAQRLGRLNRKGDMEISEAILLHQESNSAPQGYSLRASNAVRHLRERMGNVGALDVSPAALAEMLAQTKDDGTDSSVFAPRPESVPPSIMEMDALAMTSLDKVSERERVPVYLHGKSDDIPHSEVAWRRELPLFFEHKTPKERMGEWFRIFPVASIETLSERTDELHSQLAELAKRIERNTELSGRVKQYLVLNRITGEVKKQKFADFPKKKEFCGNFKDKQGCRNCVIILSSEVGGLKNGLLDGKSETNVKDVSEVEGRKKILPSEDVEDRDENLVERFDIATSQNEPEDEVCIIYRNAERSLELNDSVSICQYLGDHHEQIEKVARSIANRLGLADGIAELLAEAARKHDSGKRRSIWQAYACNNNLDMPLARNVKWASGRILGGYRHELGSMLELDWSEFSEDSMDSALMSHLIGTHHGHGRPIFKENQYDREEHTTKENRGVIERHARWFGLLSDRCGAWELAWLESLLRSADAQASREPTKGWKQPERRGVGTRNSYLANEWRIHSSDYAVEIDPRNPGHFYAACGLLELQTKLVPTSVGWFDLEDSLFHVANLSVASNSRLSLEQLCREFIGCERSGNGDKELRLGSPFDLLLDWWLDDARRRFKKTWSGNQKAEALLDNLVGLIAPQNRSNGDPIGIPSSEYPRILGKEAYTKNSTPCFDARLRRDEDMIGYTRDTLKAGRWVFPWVEALALVGLQRFHPMNLSSKQLGYALWLEPMPPKVAAARMQDKTGRDRIYAYERVKRLGGDKYSAYTYGMTPSFGTS